MNFYEQRIAMLDFTSLPKEVNSNGRTRFKLEDEFRNLSSGDKLYPTVWFLRDILELDKVQEVAENGLTIIEVGKIYDPEGTWGIYGWRGCEFDCYWFEEVDRPMSFKHYVTQSFWKYEKLNLDNSK